MCRLYLYALLFLLPIATQAQSWQQRVHYTMNVRILTDRHQMEGFQRLVYTNYSPDILDRVYYHLYFNAFQPHSMMAERNRELPDPDPRIVPRIFNLKPDEQGWHRILSLEQDGEPVTWEIHDTVMRVYLAHPILPGDSTVFTMRFFSQVPLQTRRSGWMNREGIEYSMSQWYPKIAAYDERGWHADPYVGREFYGVFGTFDVRITLPARYVVGATGVLQNPEEVGHGYAPVEPAGDSLTWHFVAHNVHDFAWAADPDYIHETVDGPDGVTIHLLYQPDVADRWKPMKEWVPELMRYYNERVGPYPYPQFTVAQAGDGGMEYPMINFITGRRSPRSLLGVTAHELAHEWFYGVLANDETDYAWMDEGFTSYAATEAVHHLLQRPGRPRHTGAYLSVIRALEEGLFEPLNTPSDWFLTNRGYSVAAYPGGEMLVDMLGMVLSDSLRDAWLRAYYNRFQFHHPKPRDLEVLAEKISGMELDWYFNQLTGMARSCDYAVEHVETHGDSSTVTLHRVDPLILPLDVELHLANGSRTYVHIPRLVAFGHKPIPEGWRVTRPWPWTSSHFSFTVPGRVTRVVLDPEGRTPDRNRLNNSSTFPIRWMLLQAPGQDWFAYRVGVRPTLSYARDFGLGAGVHLQGTYIFNQHRALFSLHAWPHRMRSFRQAVRTGLDGMLRYRHTPKAWQPRIAVEGWAARHLSIAEARLTISHMLGRFPALQSPRHELFVGLSLQQRTGTPAFQGTLTNDPLNTFWSDALVTSVFGGFRIPRHAELYLEVGAEYRRPAYALVRLEGALRSPHGYFQVLGYARAGSVPPQKIFRFGSGTPEMQWQHPAFRTLSGMLASQSDALTFFPGAGPMYPVASRVQLAASTGFGHTFSALYGGVFVSGGLTRKEVLADAGVELELRIPEISLLRKWIAQSEVWASAYVFIRRPLLSTYAQEKQRTWWGIARRL